MYENRPIPGHFQFYTYFYKTGGFLTFSETIEKLHWPKMCITQFQLINNLLKESHNFNTDVHVTIIEQ